MIDLALTSFAAPPGFCFAAEAFSKRAFRLVVAAVLVACVVQAAGAQRRLVLIDQDGSGPGGSNQMSMMALLQSPRAEVLGITMVTGDAWRDEETEHTLRMLELIGRTDVWTRSGKLSGSGLFLTHYVTCHGRAVDC